MDEIVEYRLQQVDAEQQAFREMLKEINGKLDKILEGFQGFVTDVAVERAHRQSMDARLGKAEICLKEHCDTTDLRFRTIEDKISNLEVSLAAKMAPGAIAGAVAAVIIMLFQIFM